MLKSKFINLLRTFSAGELKSFEKFIASPYFNKGRNYVPLYKILKKFYPDFNNPVLTEEYIYTKLYPKEKFNRKKASTLRSMFSRLTVMAEKFLVYNGFESDNDVYYYNLSLYNKYVAKDLYPAATNTLIRNIELIEKEGRNSNYYTRIFETNKKLGRVYFYLNNFRESHKYHDNNLIYHVADFFENASDYVNLFYTYKIINNDEIMGMELLQNFVNSYNPELIKKVFHNSNNDLQNHLLFNYYLIKTRFEEEERECLDKALKIYYSIFDKAHRTFQYNNYTFLINTLMIKGKNDFSFYGIACDLTDFVWGKGIVSHIEGGKILLGSYVTALAINTAVKNANGLRRFIDKYSHLVNRKYIDEIKYLSDTYLLFKEKNYQQCLKMVSIKHNLIPLYKIRNYKLKICCLYELDYKEDMRSVINSFKMHLKNNNVASHTLNENLNIIEGFNRLYNIKEGICADIKNELKAVSRITKNTLFGYWFKEKIEELQNSIKKQA